MRAWFAMAILVAGCLSPAQAPEPNDPGPTDPARPSEDPGKEGPGEPMPPGLGAPSPNGTPGGQPPQIDVTLGYENQTAPLPVVVTIDGMDPDGDPLAWTLVVAEVAHANGTRVPADVPVVLPVGEHRIDVWLSDGAAAVGWNQTIVVAAPPQRVEGTISGKSPGCVQQVPYDVADMGYVEADVDPATRGQPFFVHFQGNSALDLIVVLDAAGNELERAMVGVNELGPGALEMPSWTHAGTVAAEAARVVFVACDNVNNSVPLNPESEGFRYIAGHGAVADPLR